MVAISRTTGIVSPVRASPSGSRNACSIQAGLSIFVRSTRGCRVHLTSSPAAAANTASMPKNIHHRRICLRRRRFSRCRRLARIAAAVYGSYRFPSSRIAIPPGPPHMRRCVIFCRLPFCRPWHPLKGLCRKFHRNPTFLKSIDRPYQPHHFSHTRTKMPRQMARHFKGRLMLHPSQNSLGCTF